MVCYKRLRLHRSGQAMGPRVTWGNRFEGSRVVEAYPRIGSRPPRLRQPHGSGKSCDIRDLKKSCHHLDRQLKRFTITGWRLIRGCIGFMLAV